MAITTERLRHVLNYNPNTGEFHWRIDFGRWGTIKAGTKAGARQGNGYLCIGIDNVTHSAHRLAWQHYHGEVPPNYIDHINRVKTDNRIVNLRPADRRKSRLYYEHVDELHRSLFLLCMAEALADEGL